MKMNYRSKEYMRNIVYAEREVVAKELEDGCPDDWVGSIGVKKMKRKGKEILVFSGYYGNTYLTVDEIEKMKCGEEIIYGWESEDPANDLFPNEAPIQLNASDTQLQQINITEVLKTPTFLQSMKTVITSTKDLPQWVSKSILNGAQNRDQLTRKLVKRNFDKVGREMPPELEDCFCDSTLQEHQHIWQVHLWFRGLSASASEDTDSMLPFLQDNYRYDKGQLILK